MHTTDGTYNSKTDHMELNGRSTITSPKQDVEGDNIIYNSTTGDAEGHGNVKIVDKANNRTILVKTFSIMKRLDTVMHVAMLR